MSNLDKVLKLRKSRVKFDRNKSTSGIFHNWKDGDNIIRLVGGFIQLKTHYIAPNIMKRLRGLCIKEAFQGEDRIPPVINCEDWDFEREAWNEEKTCPVCKLNRFLKKFLNSLTEEDEKALTKEEKKEYEDAEQASVPRSVLKWNILNRDDPYITETTEDGEKKVLGYKIATIGMEAWDDIDGIFKQLDVDIADPQEGFDIKVIKGNNGVRTTYSASLILQGKEAKETPLTKEEQELQQHNLVKICTKLTDGKKIIDAFHSNLRDVFDVENEEKVKVKIKEEVEEKVKVEVTEDDEKEEEIEEKVSEPKEAVDEEVEEKEEVEKEEIDPTTWECWGGFEDPHTECDVCSSRVDCAKDAGVEIKKGKKGK